MTKTWFASDLHLGHENACTKFTKEDGSPLRPFANAQEMDDYIIDAWNICVSRSDRVYLLGDCVINKKFLWKLSQLNGRIVLVPGNHDIFDLRKDYPFELRGYVVKPKHPFIASHIPLHESNLYRFGLNIHGHLHANVINDPRYINVSMEQIQFAPITLDDIMERVRQNQEHYERTGNVINFANLPFKK